MERMGLENIIFMVYPRKLKFATPKVRHAAVGDLDKQPLFLTT